MCMSFFAPIYLGFKVIVRFVRVTKPLLNTGYWGELSTVSLRFEMGKFLSLESDFCSRELLNTRSNCTLVLLLNSLRFAASVLGCGSKLGKGIFTVSMSSDLLESLEMWYWTFLISVF